MHSLIDGHLGFFHCYEKLAYKFLCGHNVFIYLGYKNILNYSLTLDCAECNR